MIRKRHALKTLVENAVVATDSVQHRRSVLIHMYDGISCVVETGYKKMY